MVRVQQIKEAHQHGTREKRQQLDLDDSAVVDRSKAHSLQFPLRQTGKDQSLPMATEMRGGIGMNCIEWDQWILDILRWVLKFKELEVQILWRMIPFIEHLSPGIETIQIKHKPQMQMNRKHKVEAIKRVRILLKCLRMEYVQGRLKYVTKMEQ